MLKRKLLGVSADAAAAAQEREVESLLLLPLQGATHSHTEKGIWDSGDDPT